MSDIFNIFSKQNWCRFILSILLAWAFTYTGYLWESFTGLLKSQINIENQQVSWFILLVLIYVIGYPVLDKLINFKESVCPVLEGTNPFETGSAEMVDQQENE